MPAFIEERVAVLTSNQLVPIYCSDNVLEDISLDLVEMLLSKRSKRYIVVINDRCSKFAATDSIEIADSSSTIKVLHQQWYLWFGIPKSLITDRGRNLMPSEFEEHLKEMNFKHKPTTAYHPQSDGQTEKLYAYLDITLSIYSRKNLKDWHLHPQEVLFAYNTNAYISTKYSPFFLLYGIEARLSWETNFRGDRETEITYRLEVLEKSREIAKQNIEIIKAKSIEYQDKKKKDKRSTIGPLVLIKQPLLVKGKAKKFRDRWKGPFKITKVVGDVNYDTTNLKGPVKTDAIQVSRIRPHFLADQQNHLPPSESSSDSEDELCQLFKDSETLN